MELRQLKTETIEGFQALQAMAALDSPATPAQRRYARTALAAAAQRTAGNVSLAGSMEYTLKTQLWNMSPEERGER